MRSVQVFSRYTPLMPTTPVTPDAQPDRIVSSLIIRAALPLIMLQGFTYLGKTLRQQDPVAADRSVPRMTVVLARPASLPRGYVWFPTRTKNDEYSLSRLIYVPTSARRHNGFIWKPEPHVDQGAPVAHLAKPVILLYRPTPQSLSRGFVWQSKWNLGIDWTLRHAPTMIVNGEGYRHSRNGRVVFSISRLFVPPEPDRQTQSIHTRAPSFRTNGFIYRPWDIKPTYIPEPDRLSAPLVALMAPQMRLRWAGSIWYPQQNLSSVIYVTPFKNIQTSGWVPYVHKGFVWYPIVRHQPDRVAQSLIATTTFRPYQGSVWKPGIVGEEVKSQPALIVSGQRRPLGRDGSIQWHQRIVDLQTVGQPESVLNPVVILSQRLHHNGFVWLAKWNKDNSLPTPITVYFDYTALGPYVGWDFDVPTSGWSFDTPVSGWTFGEPEN